MFGQITAIAFVLALLLLALFLLKRRGMATFNHMPAVRRDLRRTRQLRVLERVPLTPNHSLHLVRIQDRVLLIGVSPSGCSQLDSFSQAALMAEGGESA